MAFDASLDDIAQDRLLLQRARDICEAGWCIGARRDREGNHCLVGALSVAKYGKENCGTDADFTHWRALLGPFADYLSDGWAIAVWNNQQTSVKPVLERLDAAIARLAVERAASVHWQSERRVQMKALVPFGMVYPR